ncbi:hypothetical protein [Gluconobacter oxydans]|uniref:hypothetical protein n=1 Tax=Gluconobacter oxydans TaxID=442 RepID=UPI000B09F3B3|nr:hypothetical protein [Gluconobacter oxydans]
MSQHPTNIGGADIASPTCDDHMAGQNSAVRTRKKQLASYPETVCVGLYPGNSWQLELDADDLDPDRLVEGPVLYVRCDIAHQRQKEARGSEEHHQTAAMEARAEAEIEKWSR